MRKLFLIASIFLLCSCSRFQDVHPVLNDTPHRAALDAVDTLLQQQPDSALTALLTFNDAIGDTVLNPWECSRFHLMLSELLYKNDYSQDNRTELLAAMAYYDSLADCHPNDATLVYLQARAHYMDGVGWYELDSIVPACQAYLRALQVMESHFKDDELDRNMIRFMGLINTRLASLFFYNDAVKQSIETSRKSLLYFENLGHQKSIVNALMLVGRCYGLDNSNDSAFVYFKKAQSVAEKNGFQKSQFNAMVELGPLYYEKGLKDSAFIILHEALSNCMIKDDSLATCMGLGQLFYKEHNYDSAIFYLEQSVKRETFDTETASADLLHDSYMALGDKDKASHYGEMYKKNMIHYSAKSTKKIEVITLYGKYMQQQQETHQTHMFGRYLRHTMIVVCLLVLCMAYLFLYGRFAERKSAMTQSQLSGKIKVANQLVKEQEAIITTQREKLEMLCQKKKPDFETVYVSFLQEPICRHILSVFQDENITVGLRCPAYEKLALSLEQKQQFWKAVDYYFPQFFSILAKQYPRLTTSDGRYACFYLLDINDGQIAVLMGVSYQSVWKRSKKMKEIMDGVNDLSLVMKSIAKTSII